MKFTRRKSSLFNDVNVLNENTILIDEKANEEYKIIDVLGKGGFGIVYKVKRVKDDRKFAIKELFINEKCHRVRNGEIEAYSSDIFNLFKEKVKNEVALLAKNYNDNIIHIYNSFEFNNTIYTVMEFLVGNDLERIIRRKKIDFREEEIENLIRQLANGFKNIHNEGIIHRDIKPNNIIRTSLGIYKLIDFTNIKLFIDEDRTTISTLIIGSTFSPFELMGLKKVVNIGAYSDIYSLGMTIYCCVRGVTNIPSASARKIEDSFQKDIDKLPINKVFKRLITKMTAINSEDRFQSFDEILDYLEKPCLWYECFWKFIVDKLKSISIPTFSIPSVNFNSSLPSFSLSKVLFPVLAITTITVIYTLFRGCSSENKEVIPTYSTLCNTTEKMKECIKRYRDIFNKKSTLIENIDEFKELIEGGIPIDSITNKYEETALHHLSCKGNFDFVKVLVEKGIDVNQQDKSGETALFEAIAYANRPYAINHNRKIIKLLLDSGASINIQSKKPSANSILSYVVKYKMVDIVDELVDRGVCSYEKGRKYGKYRDIYHIKELRNSTKKAIEIKKILKKGGC